MTTTNKLITENDLKNILEDFQVAVLAYGRGEIGEIKMYAGTTAPQNWLMCDGSAVSRTTYSKLFQIIGTTYGTGDGSTTFNLPDFRGRTAIGSGTGTATDATAHALGSTGGTETVTLNTNQIPSHSHNYQKPVLMYGSGGNATWPGAGSSAMGSDTWGYAGVANTGGGQAHSNLSPYITVNYIICYNDSPLKGRSDNFDTHISTVDPTSADGNDGDIWIKYEVSE